MEVVLLWGIPRTGAKIVSICVVLGQMSVGFEILKKAVSTSFRHKNKVRCFDKTQMNFLANEIQSFTWEKMGTNIALIIWSLVWRWVLFHHNQHFLHACWQRCLGTAGVSLQSHSCPMTCVIWWRWQNKDHWLHSIKITVTDHSYMQLGATPIFFSPDLCFLQHILLS